MPNTTAMGGPIELENQMVAFTPSSATVYPNPASDLLNVSIEQEVGAVELSVIDLYGRVVLQQNTQATNVELDLAKLANGMYFLRLENENFKQIEKFVIER